jgi:hypothetical protein
MSKAEPGIWIVRHDGLISKSLDRPDTERLVRATRRSEVESYVLGDYEIRRARPEECLRLGKEGAQVEEIK